MNPAYDELCSVWTRLYRFGHLQALADWDRAAMMPAHSHTARASAMAEMDGLMHGLRTDPRLSALLARADAEPLDALQCANLREIRRDWRASNALPAALIEARSLAGAHCEYAWRSQRPANDWAGFLGNFREVLRLGREAAQRLSDATGLAPYDALMDQFEPGMTGAEVDRVFGDLQQWLPGLVQRVRAHQSRDDELRGGPPPEPVGPFPVSAQRALNRDVMALLGFDFEAGRLDESAHPFSGGVPEDTRLTTRYSEASLMQGLLGTIHETGHGRYEQNLPRDWLGQPVANPRSMAIHESQSLSFEMQLGRSREFAGVLAPMLAAGFGAQAAFEPDALYRSMTRVSPGLIRVDADELTYPAHVILRYRIERALIEGHAEADDIPALWDEAMQSLLGIDTRGNFKDGCLQDVHWSGGWFGYFPCYTLGAMYAAQWFATIRRDMLPGLGPDPGSDLDARIARADFAPVFDWLREHIWSQASRWSTAELAQRASGEALNPAHFRRHLEARYLG